MHTPRLRSSHPAKTTAHKPRGLATTNLKMFGPNAPAATSVSPLRAVLSYWWWPAVPEVCAELERLWLEFAFAADLEEEEL